MDGIKPLPHIKSAAHAKVSIRSIGLRFGLMAGAAMIVYFLIMRALDLAHVTELRYINYLFLVGGIWLALREEKRQMHANRLDYLPGLGTGFWATAATALTYSIFMLIYVLAFEPKFFEMVAPHLPFGSMVTPPMLAFVTFGETTVFGIIATFVLMQLLKRNGINTSQKRFDQ